MRPTRCASDGEQQQRQVWQNNRQSCRLFSYVAVSKQLNLVVMLSFSAAAEVYLR